MFFKQIEYQEKINKLNALTAQPELLNRQEYRTLLQDDTFLKEIFRANKISYLDLPLELREQPNLFLWFYYYNHDLGLAFAPEKILNDPDTILKAIDISSSIFYIVAQRMVQDQEFNLAALEINSRFVDCLDDADNKFGLAGSRKFNLLKEEIYQNKKILIELGVNPNRIKNNKELKQIIKDLKNFKEGQRADDRQLAFVPFPEHNWIGLSAQQNMISTLLKNDLEVIPTEIIDFTEFKAGVRSFRYYKPIKIFLVCGSGQFALMPIKISFQSIKNGCDTEHGLGFDIDKRLPDLWKYLDKKSLAVLASCYAGDGKAADKNMANVFKKIATYSRIVAPTESIYGIEMDFVSGTDLPKVDFINMSKTNETYITDGEKF